MLPSLNKVENIYTLIANSEILLHPRHQNEKSTFGMADYIHFYLKILKISPPNAFFLKCTNFISHKHIFRKIYVTRGA